MLLLLVGGGGFGAALGVGAYVMYQRRKQQLQLQQKSEKGKRAVQPIVSSMLSRFTSRVRIGSGKEALKTTQQEANDESDQPSTTSNSSDGQRELQFEPLAEGFEGGGGVAVRPPALEESMTAEDAADDEDSVATSAMPSPRRLVSPPSGDPNVGPPRLLPKLSEQSSVGSLLSEVGPEESDAHQLSQLRESGHTVKQLRRAGYSVDDLSLAGYSLEEIAGADFTDHELRGAGYTAAEIAQAKARKKAPTFQAMQPAARRTGAPRYQQNYSSPRATSRASDLVAEDLTASPPIAQAASQAQELPSSELKASGHSLAQLKRAGYDATDLREGGFTAAELLKGLFRLPELLEAGFSMDELREAGVPESDLAKHR